MKMNMHKLAGFLGALAIIAVAPTARADFNITVDGTSCATGAGNPTNPGGEVGNCTTVTPPSTSVTITNLGTQGTQTSANSQQFSSTLTINNAGSSSVTVIIGTVVNDFTLPKTPPDVTDTYTYTLNGTTGSITASTYTPCVDTANSLTVGAGVCGTPQSLTISGNHSTSSPTGSLLLTSLGPSFALSQTLSLTLAANTSLNITESQILTQVPEPSAIVLLGTLFIGFATIFRKKLARQS